MKTFIVKNNFSLFGQILKINKSFRVNLGGVNFSVYKFSKKKFCIDKSKINKRGIKADVSNPKENESNIDTILNDIDSVNTKNISLNLYNDANVPIETEKEKLPIRTEKINEDLEVEIFTPNKELSKAKNFEQFKHFLEKKERYEKDYRNHKMKVAFCLFFLLLGLFSLWLPFYKVICERQGYSVKTSHTDYKFDGRKCKFNNNINP